MGKTVTWGVGESQKIQVWESQVTRDGTPLLAFFRNWKKLSDLTQAKKVSEQEKLDDYAHIPLLKKNQKKMRMKAERAEAEEVTGFLSGSDDEDFDEEENFKLKEERGMKRKRHLLKRKLWPQPEQKYLNPTMMRKQMKTP